MSEHFWPNPEQPTETKEKDVLSLFPEKYLVYSDRQEELEGNQKETKLLNNQQFLEFFKKEIRPDYRQFFNNLFEQQLKEAGIDKNKDFLKDQDILKIFQEYEKKLELLHSNYSTPLTDQEAIQALIFLKKENEELAKNKVRAWRELSTKQFNYPEGEIIYLARKGFNIKKIAPTIKDKHHITKVKSGGLCYNDFDFLQKWNFRDADTKDEIRFFIPRLVPGSLDQSFQEQRLPIYNINSELTRMISGPSNLTVSIGEANQIVNQILVHKNLVGEEVPSNLDYTRTMTSDGEYGRLVFGYLDDKGLRCNRRRDDAPISGYTGIFVLGGEEIK